MKAPQLALFGTAISLLVAAPLSAKEEPADLILTGGVIHGAKGQYEALAVRNGQIIQMGDAASISALKGPDTRIIALDGQSVLPGFHDTHVHPIFGGIRKTQCVINQGADIAALTASVQACADRAEPGTWITGGQWDAATLGRIPTKALLDAVSADIPMFLTDTSGHSSLANSKALEIAGVTKETPTPEGGIIEKDADGNPTGVFRETAIDLVQKHVPRPSYQAARDALAYSANLMLSVGITSFTEASLGFTAGADNELRAYADLSDAGILKQRVRICLNWAPDVPEMEAVIQSRNTFERPNIRVDCIKMFLDGVPTDSHTAAMVDPYADTVEGRDDDAARYGLLLVPQDALNDGVARFDQMGLSVKFHAAGDAAVRAGIDAVAEARKRNGTSGVLHDIGHATFVHPDDYGRARAANAVMELSPYLWGPSPINDDISKAVGPERIMRVWPFRDLLDAGELVVAGSDWSVVPSVNPWPAIETMLTRERWGGSDDTFGKPQAITIEEALTIFTENGARYSNQGHRLGKLEVGYIADLIVVNQNPYTVSVTDLHKTTVTHTLIDGHVVYERAP